MGKVLQHVDLTLVNIGSKVKEICTSPKRLYQYLTYDQIGGRLYIETPVFQCEKLSKSNFNAGLQIAIPIGALQELIKLDNHVSERFNMPACAPDKWKNTAMPFKRFAETVHDRIYLKIDDNLRVFDIDRHEISPQQLGEGDYKAVIKIFGIYIGSHGELEKYASLQARVVQLMFKPSFSDACLFHNTTTSDFVGADLDVIEDLSVDNSNNGSPPPPPSPSFDRATSVALSAASLSRLPPTPSSSSAQQTPIIKLERQNTIAGGGGGRKRKVATATAQDKMQLTLDFKAGKKKKFLAKQPIPPAHVVDLSVDEEEEEEEADTGIKHRMTTKKKLVQHVAPTIVNVSDDDEDEGHDTDTIDDIITS